MAFYHIPQESEQQEMQQPEALDSPQYRPGGQALEQRLLPLDFIGFSEQRLRQERMQLIGNRMQHQGVEFTHFRHPGSQSNLINNHAILGRLQLEAMDALEQRMRHHEALQMASARLQRQQMEGNRLRQEALAAVEHRLRLEGMHAVEGERLRQEALGFVEQRLRQEGVEVAGERLLQEVLILLEHRLWQAQMHGGLAGNYRLQQQQGAVGVGESRLQEDNLEMHCEGLELEEGSIREQNDEYGEQNLPILQLADRRMHEPLGYAHNAICQEENGHSEQGMNRVLQPEIHAGYSTQNKRLETEEDEGILVSNEAEEDASSRLKDGNVEMEEQETQERYALASLGHHSLDIAKHRLHQEEKPFTELGMQNGDLDGDQKFSGVPVDYEEHKHQNEGLGRLVDHQESNSNYDLDTQEPRMLQRGEEIRQQSIQYEELEIAHRTQQENCRTEDLLQNNRSIPPQVRKSILAVLMAVLAVLMMLVHHLQQQRARGWEDAAFDTFGLETNELLVATMLKLHEIQSFANSLSADIEEDNESEEEYGSDFESDA